MFKQRWLAAVAAMLTVSAMAAPARAQQGPANTSNLNGGMLGSFLEPGRNPATRFAYLGGFATPGFTYFPGGFANSPSWEFLNYLTFLMNGGNPYWLAGTLGSSLGGSLANGVFSNTFFYLNLLQYGYGGGRPLVYPSPLLMGLINGSPQTAPGLSGPGLLQINAPRNAAVWVDGNALSWGKQGWAYRTPALGPNDVRSVAVRVRWGASPYEVTRNAQVVLRPGDRQSVTFIGGAADSP